MNNIYRVGRFLLGLILGLLLIALLVWLVLSSLSSWRVYEKGNNLIVHQNDGVVLGNKCCLVQAVPCCPEKKPEAKAKPKPTAKYKPRVKQIPKAVVVEEIIPRAVVIEQSIPTADPRSVGPSSLLNGVDPYFGKATVRSREDREVRPTVRRKRYIVRQSPSLYSGVASGGCPYRYGCEYRSTYPQYVNTYAPQVTYGQPYIPPPQTVFIPAAPVIVPAPSVVTPAGTYGQHAPVGVTNQTTAGTGR